MRHMQNLLKIAIVAAGGTTKVAASLGVQRATVSRYISGDLPFPVEKVRQLCDEGGDIIDAKRLTVFLADREAERARAKVMSGAAS